MSIRRLIPLLAVAFLLLLTGGPTVDAQEGDALRFFQQNPSRPLFRLQSDVSRPSSLPRNRPRPDGAPRRRIAPETPLVAEPEKIVVPITTFVHVLGDSLSDLLAQGLKEQLAETKPEVGVVKRGRTSSGLVRDDYYDWGKALRELLAGADKVDLVVMMLGSNDRQSLRDETGSHEFNSERWRDVYLRRLEDLLVQAKDKRVPFILVGMPPMQGQRLSADMLALNAMFRERAQRNGAGYVDIWEAFATEQGAYSAMGPDVNGEIVRIRTSDGVHFTKAGARKLGFFVSKEVDQQLGRSHPEVTIAALPTDLSEQIRRDTPSLVPQSFQPLPLPSELPSLPAIGQRPLTGPTVALTNPPQTAGGEIFTRKLVVPTNEMTIMVEQVLTYGRLPPPKPGRADDFSWPKAN